MFFRESQTMQRTKGPNDPAHRVGQVKEKRYRHLLAQRMFSVTTPTDPIIPSRQA